MPSRQTAASQLALNVQLRDEATLENFLPNSATAPLLPMLEGQLSDGGEPLIYLHGPADAGKSHLLQACCQGSSQPALYLPLEELSDCAPADILTGIEQLALLCLDDLDAVIGDAAWEEALFHLLNRARAANCRVLVGAAASPRALALSLADLRSRLSWGLVYQLPVYSDEEKVALLQFRARRRGLHLPDEVGRFVVSRAPRALGQLLELLARLDAHSLAAQRALTVPFVKEVLGW